MVENELPYSEILTADYVMANPEAAEAYGASTEFGESASVHSFKPSEVLSYYRRDGGYVVEEDPVLGPRVANPGPLSTDYPHAGILNTKVFLQRYPTTPTNRNRARSRWTYYHFLGLDVEASAPRTTDPVALADTNNPTMRNPACTVCHAVLDPVAGAFQNYGDEGLYRDQWGGMDALDRFYKESPPGRTDFPISGRVPGETLVSLGIVTLLTRGENELGLKNLRTFEGDTKLHLGLGELIVRALDGDVVQRYETRDVAEEEACGGRVEEGYILWDCGEMLVLPLVVPEDGDYSVEIEAWVFETGEKAATLQAWMPGPFYRTGDTWYRDMRTPGLQEMYVPDADASLPWLAKQVISDPRFAEAAVKFWWPAVMGSEIAVPPADENDANFRGLLTASNAQTAEVERLAGGLRRGFRGRSPYNLIDLLVEVVLSKWFRAKLLTDDDPVHAVALRGVGARRLLTPEELARKTLGVTGFQWGRFRGEDWRAPHEEHWSALSDSRVGYGLLYGGIDSDGVTARAQNLSSVMASVAQSHAVHTSCPIVMKELYLLAPENRRLFAGVDTTISPISEFSRTFEVEAASRDDKATLSLSGSLEVGRGVATLSFLNDYYDEARGDRNLRLDRLEIRDSRGQVVVNQELEDLERLSDCNYPVDDHFALQCSGSLEVPVDIPSAGRYDIQVVVWADQAGDDLPKLVVSLGSDPERSAGSRVIKDKLVELYGKLHGSSVSTDSAEVRGAYALFVDVWNRRRASEYGDFKDWEEGIDCNWWSDQYYLDGIVEDAFVYREDWDDEWGARYDWDWDRINAHFETIDWSDTHGVARTWTVVLAYLLMDYRYLYL